MDNSALFSALAKFQSSMTNIHKDKTANVPTKSGGSFKYSYADIAGVIEAVKEPMAAHGLCYLQTLDNIDGKPALRTILAHESGASIEGIIPFSGDLSDPQKFGGTCTYYRRYALLGILGLATDDDDAQHASQTQPSGHAQRAMDAHRESLKTTAGNTGGASQRVDEEMDWTELYSLTRPLGYKDRPAIEALIDQSIEGMSPKQVYDAFKRAYKADGGTGELAQSTAPRRQVQWPLSEKQLATIRSVLPKKGMDMKAWPGWMMYTLDTDQEISPEDLSKAEASKIIDALFAMPDNKEMQAAIEASGGVMAHGR